MVKAVKHCNVPYKEIGVPEKTVDGDQKKWVAFTVLIATYGFLKNISPECPYIAEFFVGPRFNFTTTQVTQEIYPVSVYASVVQTFIVLLVTDILKYKPIIVIGAIGIIIHKALLVWGRTVLEMQANQFFWGTSKACALAYKTYIYSKVDRGHYQRVTAIIRIAPKAGTLFSSVLSQVALSIFFIRIEQLNRISLCASAMALVCAVLLPSLKHSLYFDNDKVDLPPNGPGSRNRYSHAVWLLWQDFKEAYTNPYIVKWCIWWILATGGFQQVTDYYIQVLWSEISRVNQNKYNAFVEAVYTVVSGVACLLVGGMAVDWPRRGELVLGLCTLLKAVALLYSAGTHSIVTSYVIYVAFGTLYDVMMVISNSEVAKHLRNESFALIFGINTFLALSCQSLLTYVLTSKYAFALPIRKQFIGVGFVFLALGFGFLFKAFFDMLFGSKSKEVEAIDEGTPIVRPVPIPQKPALDQDKIDKENAHPEKKQRKHREFYRNI